MSASQRKAAVVTGAASGIGLAVAHRLAAAGHELCLIDRAREILGAAVDSLEAKHPVHTVVADLASTDGALQATDDAMSAVPHASVLVCSAGILRPGNLAELPIECWDEMFAVHARSPLLMAQGFVSRTREAAAQDPNRHRIVAISSTAAVRPRTGNGAYAASKSALNMTFRILAAELAPVGYNVNIVTPGLTNTPLVTAGASAGTRAGWSPSSLPPIGRMAEPQDIAATVGYLCGPDSAFVTGANIVVDGGSTAAVRGG